MTNWTRITAADDVPEALLAYAVEVTDSHYSDEQPIDWDDVVDRIDGFELADGTRADLGQDLLSPAIRKIKRHVNQTRKDSPR